MIEFNITTDLEPIRCTEIQANFDECKRQLTEMMQPYAGLVVTEDGISSAKADRAKINKISAKIDDTRKTVKKVYSAPLTAFEKKAKELTAICDNAAANLDGQIKAFEERTKAEKLDRLLTVYTENIGSLEKYLPFQSIADSRWGNATYKEDQAANEIRWAIEACGKDLEVIHNLGSEFEPALLDLYKTCRSLGAVMTKEQEFQKRKAEKEAIEAEKKRLEEEQRAQAAQFAPLEEPETQEIQEQIAEPDPEQEPEPEEPVYMLQLDLACTKSQFATLTKYAKSLGIQVISARRIT